MHLKTGILGLENGAVSLYFELRAPLNRSDVSEKIVLITCAYMTCKHYEEYAEQFVNHFTSDNGRSVEVLTFDMRGIGRSKPCPVGLQSTEQLAGDVRSLIDHVWGSKAKVHIMGASLGGMVAQKLAVTFAKADRLNSLFLMSTNSRAPSWVWPCRYLGLTVCSWILQYRYKWRNQHQMINEVWLPASFNRKDFRPEFNNEQHKQLRDHFAKEWEQHYDDWWAFNDSYACGSQLSAVFSHGLTQQDAEILIASNSPISVLIAERDRAIPCSEQHELADALKARKFIFDQGHIPRNGRFQKTFIAHLEDAFKNN